MCSAAAAFVGVGELPHIAPDPWAIVAQAEDPGVEASKLLRSVGPAEDEWLVSSNVFLPAERGDQEGRRHAGAGAQPGTRAGDRRHRRRSPPARSECRDLDHRSRRGRGTSGYLASDRDRRRCEAAAPLT